MKLFNFEGDRRLHPNSEKAFSLGMSQAEPNYREYKYLCENVKSTLVALEGLCQAKNDAETAQKLFCKGIQVPARRNFLELCYAFDSQTTVCGLGKDNLVASGWVSHKT